MLAVQLHALDAPVVVDLQAIGEVYARTPADPGVFRRAADVAEGNGLDGLAGRRARRAARSGGAARSGRAARTHQLHFQMLAGEDARVQDLKIPVEQRLRKALSPGAGAA